MSMPNSGPQALTRLSITNIVLQKIFKTGLKAGQAGKFYINNTDKDFKKSVLNYRLFNKKYDDHFNDFDLSNNWDLKLRVS